MRDGMPGREFTFDAEKEGVKNPNNVKPEAEMEWGYGGIPPEFYEQQNAGEVDRHLPESAEFDAGPVIRFARDQMNRGLGRAQLLASLQERFGRDLLLKAAPALRPLMALEGIIGRIAIDGRGYKSCKQALMLASKSPYKHFIRHVVGCQCGDPQMVPLKPKGGAMGAVEASTGNGIDDFFADGQAPAPKMVSHCRSTMLPILSGMGDLDESEMDGTLIDLMNLTNLPEGDVENIRTDSTKKPLEKVRAAFQLVDRRLSRSMTTRYRQMVDASEHRLAQADNEIALDPVASTPELDVDHVNHAIQHTVDVNADPLQAGLDINGRGLMADVDLANIPVPETIDVDGNVPLPYGIQVEAARQAEADLRMEHQKRAQIDGVFDMGQLREVEVDPQAANIHVKVDKARQAKPELQMEAQPERSRVDGMIDFAPNAMPMDDLVAAMDVKVQPERQVRPDLEMEQPDQPRLDSMIAVDGIQAQTVEELDASMALDFESLRDNKPISVDHRGGMQAVELEGFGVAPDIDLLSSPDAEFIGADEIELEMPTSSPGDLDVDMGGGMSW
jgi:hypothetical protein